MGRYKAVCDGGEVRVIDESDDVQLVVDERMVIWNAYGRVGNVETEHGQYVIYWGPVRSRFVCKQRTLNAAIEEWIATISLDNEFDYYHG